MATRTGHRAGGAATAFAALAFGAAASAETFVASNGASIALDDVSGMSCAALAAKLAEIDATGYRGPRPEPENRHDRRLLDYETEVSIRYYSGCSAVSGAGAAGEVLRGGFRSGD